MGSKRGEENSNKLRTGLVAIIHEMRGHDTTHQQVMTQFLAH